MKFINLILYVLVINSISNLLNFAVANDIDDSYIYRLPAKTDNLNTQNSAKFLIPDSSTQQETTPQILSQPTITEQKTKVDYSISPLESNFLEPINIESANVLPQGSLEINGGAVLFRPGSEGNGLGWEVYNASVKYGLTQNLQFSLDLSFLDDIDNVLNRDIPFGIFALAPSLKYQFIDEISYNIAIVGSLEWLKIRSANAPSENTLAATIPLPVTYNVTENIQWNFVPGLAVFPDSVSGGDFYGTFLNFGTGISIKLGEKLGFLVDLNVPVSIGSSSGNSVSKTGEVSESLVWSVGINYLHSPNLSLSVFGTNRLGSTPATKLLAFSSDAGEMGVGLNLKYTPDFGYRYSGNFAYELLPSMDEREKQLVFDGIILSSPNTVRKGMFILDGGVGSSNHAQVGYGLSDNAQLELIAQKLANNDQPIGDSTKLGVGVKFNFLNQSLGDSFSLAARGAFQDASGLGDDTIGSLFAEMIFLYSSSDKIALTFNPKAGFFGDESIVGAGLGVNFQLFPGFQLIGEVTPMVSDDPSVWAAGARYQFPKSNLGLGIYGTNASGQGNIGSLIKSDDVSVGVNLLWLLGGQSVDE